MSEINKTTSISKEEHSGKIFADIEYLEQITGRSKRQCYRYVEQIKDFFSKKSHHRITISEVHEYFGLN